MKDAVNDRIRVLILSYHFYPDAAIGARRVSELAGFLKSRGCSVSAISMKPGPDDRIDESLSSEIEGIDVIRVSRPPKLFTALLKLRSLAKGIFADAPAKDASAVTPAAAGVSQEKSGERKESFRQRLKRYMHSLEWLIDDKKLWSLLVSIRAIGMVRRNRIDVVISSGPPHSIHMAALLTRVMTRTRWIMDMRDPWSADRSHLHVKSAFTMWIESVSEKMCLSRADLVTTASPGIAAYVRDRMTDGRVEVILNGFDGQPNLGGSPFSGQLRCVYAGTLYYNRNPFPLFEAIKKLLESTDIQRQCLSVYLVGHCNVWNGNDVLARVRSMGLDDVIKILPPVDRHEVADLLAGSDIILNFAQGQPIQIPAKLFEIIASGKEMLLISELDSDSSALVRESASGVIVDPDSTESYVEAIRKLYEKYVIQGRAYVPDPERIALYSRNSQNKRLFSMMEELLR